MVSWVALKEICPIDLETITKKATLIDNRIMTSPNKNDLDSYKENLLKARGDLDVLIGELISVLNNVDLLKTNLDLGLYRLLKDDLAGYLAIIDERQGNLLEVFDGEPKAGIGKTMAFRNILFVALRGIIYDSLYTSSLEYRRLPLKIEIELEDEKKGKITKEIKKDKNLFLRILFLVLSSKLTVLGGIQRRKHPQTGKVIVDYSTPNFRKTLTTKGQEAISKEYQERFGEGLDFSDEEDLFGEEENASMG